MREYFPIVLFTLVAVGFAAVTIGLSTLLTPQRLSPRKLEPYECGVEPVGNARTRFKIHFYLVAVLFILFDVEIVFLYPWAVAFRHLGLFALIEMTLFIVVLAVGYFYLLKKRALEWD